MCTCFTIIRHHLKQSKNVTDETVSYLRLKTQIHTAFHLYVFLSSWFHDQICIDTCIIIHSPQNSNAIYSDPCRISSLPVSPSSLPVWRHRPPWSNWRLQHHQTSSFFNISPHTNNVHKLRTINTWGCYIKFCCIFRICKYRPDVNIVCSVHGFVCCGRRIRFTIIPRSKSDRFITNKLNFDIKVQIQIYILLIAQSWSH